MYSKVSGAIMTISVFILIKSKYNKVQDTVINLTAVWSLNIAFELQQFIHVSFQFLQEPFQLLSLDLILLNPVELITHGIRMVATSHPLRR